MIEHVVFIFIISLLIGGMLWSDRDSQKQKGFKFLGYDDNVYFGEGRFTKGDVYRIVSGSISQGHNGYFARFIGSDNVVRAEHTRYFKEVK